MQVVNPKDVSVHMHADACLKLARKQKDECFFCISSTDREDSSLPLFSSIQCVFSGALFESIIYFFMDIALTVLDFFNRSLSLTVRTTSIYFFSEHHLFI